MLLEEDGQSRAAMQKMYAEEKNAEERMSKRSQTIVLQITLGTFLFVLCVTAVLVIIFTFLRPIHDEVPRSKARNVPEVPVPAPALNSRSTLEIATSK